MRTTYVFIAALGFALGTMLERGGCYADDCARAVTGRGGSPDASSRMADCSSLMVTTVTPPIRYVLQQL